MSCMVFQASRRQLLAHLIDYIEQYEAGKAPTITIVNPPSPPVDQDSTATPDFTASEQPLTKPGLNPSKPSRSAQVGVVEGKNPDEDDPEARSRKIENLRKAVHTADQEVKKMEFWSDIKDVARRGESVTAEDGWNDLGISGASMGNEKVFGGAGHGGVPEERERVDIKGKGKAVQQ
ncbi:hypothetical protein K440DRAFT_631671 [Wilcoxina mikolae CBS 423.85]|nr:hypothetical protein K440DRAFT_631671 [Wilcoxina mikolae CBS 423.85]